MIDQACIIILWMIMNCFPCFIDLDGWTMTAIMLLNCILITNKELIAPRLPRAPNKRLPRAPNIRCVYGGLSAFFTTVSFFLLLAYAEAMDNQQYAPGQNPRSLQNMQNWQEFRFENFGNFMMHVLTYIFSHHFDIIPENWPAGCELTLAYFGNQWVVSILNLPEFVLFLGIPAIRDAAGRILTTAVGNFIEQLQKWRGVIHHLTGGYGIVDETKRGNVYTNPRNWFRFFWHDINGDSGPGYLKDLAFGGQLKGRVPKPSTLWRDIYVPHFHVREIHLLDGCCVYFNELVARSANKVCKHINNDKLSGSITNSGGVLPRLREEFNETGNAAEDWLNPVTNITWRIVYKFLDE